MGTTVTVLSLCYLWGFSVAAGSLISWWAILSGGLLTSGTSFCSGSDFWSDNFFVGIGPTDSEFLSGNFVVGFVAGSTFWSGILSVGLVTSCIVCLLGII